MTLGLHAESEHARLISREIIFEVFRVTMRYLNVTDIRTDGRTTFHGNTALCVAYRAVKTAIRI